MPDPARVLNDICGAGSEQVRYDLLLGMARPEKSILWKVASATAVTVGDR